MFFDPLTYLIVRNRVQKENLDSSEALKATLLGSAVGGGNMATSVFFADRSIRQKARENKPVVIEPVTCIDNLLASFESFLNCMEKDEANADKLNEFKKIFSEIGKNLVVDEDDKKKIDAKLKSLFADKVAARTAVSRSVKK